MKKINLYKTILTFIFVFVLTLSMVNANYYWSQESNSNYDLGVSGVKGIAYGSNYNNPVSNLTENDYGLCSITKSDYTPIISDFGQTGKLKVVVTDKSTSKLSIYNPDCSLFEEISVSGTITAMPVLINPKNYFDQKIAVLTSKYLKIYEYNLISNEFDLISSILIPTGGTSKYLTCFDYEWDSLNNPICFVIVEYLGGTYGFIVDIETENVNYVSSVLNPSVGGITESFNYNGLSNIRNPVDEEKFYIPFGLFDTYNNKYYGNLLDINNVSILSTIVYDGSDTFSISHNYYKDSSDFIAKIGTSYKIFSYRRSGLSTGNKCYNSVFINDLSGNNIFFLSSEEFCPYVPDSLDNISYKRFSNWAVADYDKDGSNEACFLIKKVNDEIWFQCYESYGGFTGISDISVNYTGIINDISNIVLADFIPSKNVLGFATKEGIFYPTEKVFSTNKPADFGFPIVTFKETYSLLQTPMYVYTDNDEGFIVSADVTIDTCGDGECQTWETPVSCPEDCAEPTEPDEDEEGEYREGSPCQTDEDCADGLKCEYGVCVKLTFGDECNYDSDCLSGICLNGRCTKASLWVLIDRSKDQMYGDDTPTNNFLSLVFMICIGGVIGAYVAIWAGVLTFFMLAIFFALVGWLSAFILIGMFLIGIILMVFAIIIGSKSQ